MFTSPTSKTFGGVLTETAERAIISRKQPNIFLWFPVNMIDSSDG